MFFQNHLDIRTKACKASKIKGLGCPSFILSTRTSPDRFGQIQIKGDVLQKTTSFFHVCIYPQISY